MIDCVFCGIVRHEAPAKVVFEDDLVLAFAPLVSVTRGHTLVIPKKHHESMRDIDAETWRVLCDRTRTIARDLMRDQGATGVNLLHAGGKDAQQSIFHCHIHLVPRYPDDGLDLWLRNRL